MASAEKLGIDNVLDVLQTTFGLDGDLLKGKEFRILCPVHEMDTDDHKPSVDVNLETGYWNCFSCPARGDVIDLGVLIREELDFSLKITKKKSKRYEWYRARDKVQQILVPTEPEAITAAARNRLRAARRAVANPRAGRERFQPIVPPVDAYRFKFPRYLKDRDFRKDTLKRWKIRYTEETTLFREDNTSFTITEAVAIPIFDATGRNVLAWCYRATDKSEPWFRNARYIYTPGVSETLSKIWFGMHLHRHEPVVDVVEGALDAIWEDQNGFPALAILGSQVKQIEKVRLLMNFRKVNLLCDRDTSGITTTIGLGDALRERGVPATVGRYPAWMLNRRGEPAKDAQDLCGLDLELVHARMIPYTVWKRKIREAA